MTTAARRFVVATAGHVDHGKSTLVRALTGIEPDRWEQERRRGLTIDLGFAWTTLDSGADVAFVDVPGHERFLGNMLAGLGPAPVVMLVVAADEGWSAQSAEHLEAIAALGIDTAVIVLTRTDRPGADVDAVSRQVRAQVADTGLAQAPIVAVNALTGEGLERLRAELDTVLAAVPPASDTGRVRLWIDRAFSIRGAGTIVTGTLAAGTLAVGDALELAQGDRSRSVTVRGLQQEGVERGSVGPVSRVAVNLRGVDAQDVHRGQALLTPGAWPSTSILDVRRVTGTDYPTRPTQLTVHVGSAAVGARVRPLGPDHARLTLDHALPLVVGDRLVLRDHSAQRLLGGAQVLDIAPPTLTRRGDGAERTRQLTQQTRPDDVSALLERVGAVRVADLVRAQLLRDEQSGADLQPPDGVIAHGGWWIVQHRWSAWTADLMDLVAAHHADDPLSAGVSAQAVVERLGLPDGVLLDPLTRAAGVRLLAGRVQAAESLGLGAAEEGLAHLEQRLRVEPFAAPEAADLDELGLGVRELAAAERLGRVIRLDGGVVLLPSAPALAMRTLSGLPQPFTTSQARQALSTTRRVVIPLLEHLDTRGWTRRLDAGHREVRRG